MDTNISKIMNDGKNDFMELGKALDLVLNLAKVFKDLHPPSSKITLNEYQTAIDTVEDFIVNNFGEDK